MLGKAYSLPVSPVSVNVAAFNGIHRGETYSEIIGLLPIYLYRVRRETIPEEGATCNGNLAKGDLTVIAVVCDIVDEHV